MKKNFIFVLIAIFSLITLFYSHFAVKKPVIYGDGIGYYSYVYNFFEFGDLSFTNTEAPRFGVNTQEELPNNLNKYPVGTSLFLLPAYISAKITTVLFSPDRAGITAYTTAHHVFVGLFGIAYLLLALKILQKILLRFFDEKTTNITLVSIALGTNLLLYSSAEASFSHLYSFLAINLFLYLLIKWRELQNKKTSILLGLSVGLVLLLRQSNITILAIFLFYGIELSSFKESIQSQITFYKKNAKNLALIALSALGTFLPQVIYWLYATGKLIIYSYKEENFDFLRPQIFQALFGMERGLFFWAPILIIAVCGVWFAKKRLKNISLGLIVFMALNMYIVSSWWMWDYGVGHGHRAFTDFLGIFALWFAVLISELSNYKLLRRILLVALPILIFINLAFAIGYLKQRIYYTDTTFTNILEPVVKFRFK